MSRLPVLILIAAAASLGGCEGQYTFTIPEQVAPAGDVAIVVAKLQKSEFANISPPAKNICMRFKVADGPLSAAYTDNRGYAAANVSVPAVAGRYHVVAEIMDKDGREASAFSPVYVLEVHPAAVAIDLECLAGLSKNEFAQAQATLAAISQRAYIIYFTDSTADQTHRHEQLKAEGFPDGAILQWQRQFWHATKEGVTSRVIVEDRMVSQLPILRQMLPNLKMGVANSRLSAEAFAKADMKCIAVGPESIFQKMPASAQRMNWQQLARQWQVGGKRPVTQPASQESEPANEPATQSAVQMTTKPEIPATQPEANLVVQPATESSTQPTTKTSPQPTTQMSTQPEIPAT
jgi:hypothetical protein